MNYFKLTFKIDPDNQDYREILFAMLGELGFESFVENESSIDAYIQTIQYTPDILYNMDVGSMFSFTYEIEEILDQNWNEIWEKNYFKPLVINDRCVIRAPFHTEYPRKEYEIIIEPNMAFGTGNHETTAMMIQYILELDILGKRVLDMGCGTGILSILASKCGASSITAIDIDKWSYEGTTENSKLNSTVNIIPILGDAFSIPEARFDFIFANIQKNIIISDIKEYVRVLDEDGILVVSGFYTNDLNEIIGAANNLGLKLISFKKENNWCAASFVFSQDIDLTK